MKKIISTLCTLFIAAMVTAQVPDVMNYQAVARNNAGAALANQTIKVRLTINKNAVAQYSETRQVTTNALGLFNVQIGSAGAISTTGSFSGINWQNNAAPGYVLKVELDINNTNVFTDMGSQALVTVPFAFASKKADEATETVNIAGRPVDQAATPTVGARLSWNGTSWTPVKKDSVIAVAKSGVTIVTGGSSPPWAFAGSGPHPTITVTGNETIVATFTGSFGHNSTGNLVAVSASMCYQNISGGAITEFNAGIYTSSTISSAAIASDHNMTILTATGAIKLPAGTYRIGLGIKNFSNTINLANNGNINGVIEIKN